MKVIVLGATGFIGLPASQALVRSGHTVYGVTRSADKASVLLREEIHPIIGDPTSCWLHLVPTIDVVIQLIGGRDYPSQRLTFENFIAACKESRSADAPKIAYIQTTGVAVFGDNRIDIVSDLTPYSIPNSRSLPLMEELIEIEQMVLKNDVVNGIVIRPGFTYGGKSPDFLSMLLKTAIETGVSMVMGTPGQKRSGCHVVDLADLFVRAAEKASIIGGLAFVATAEIISMDEFAKRTAELVGAKEVVYKEVSPSNLTHQIITATQLCRPFLARTLLGWTPKKLPFLENFETYIYAALAARPEDEKFASLLKEKFNL